MGMGGRGAHHTEVDTRAALCKRTCLNVSTFGSSEAEAGGGGCAVGTEHAGGAARETDRGEHLHKTSVAPGRCRADGNWRRPPAASTVSPPAPSATAPSKGASESSRPCTDGNYPKYGSTMIVAFTHPRHSGGTAGRDLRGARRLEALGDLRGSPKTTMRFVARGCGAAGRGSVLSFSCSQIGSL